MNLSIIGWSTFALQRNVAADQASRFLGDPQELLPLIQRHWASRQPGTGRKDLSQVVVVPIQEGDLTKYFSSSWIPIEEASQFEVSLRRRQPHEDPYLYTTALGTPLPVRRASVVLYSKETLLENGGTCEGPYEWEIVAVLAGPWEQEPMMPLTMARNYLEKTGGTYAPYTSQQLAESIYHWAGFVQQRKE
jgi:hypothetical protein